MCVRVGAVETDERGEQQRLASCELMREVAQRASKRGGRVCVDEGGAAETFSPGFAGVEVRSERAT